MFEITAAACAAYQASLDRIRYVVEAANGQAFYELSAPPPVQSKHPPTGVRSMIERDVENYLVKRVKELGGEVRKVQWLGRRGAPDRLVMLPAYCTGNHRWPRTLWVELKALGQKAKPHQVREHDRMRAMGQRVVVIDSFEGVDEVLA